MPKYKTKDDTQTGFVPGVGEIKDGLITSSVAIESPNLVLVNESLPPAPATPAAPVAPPTQNTQTPIKENE